MSKRAIAILGAIFILIVGTLGFLIYLKYSKKSAPQTQLANQVINQTATTTSSNDSTNTNNNQNQNNNQNDNVTSGGLVKLTSQTVVAPVLFYSGNGVTYFDSQGNLYRSDFDNSTGNLSLVRTKQFSIEPKTGISRVLWPKQGNNFIVEFNTSGLISYSLFDSSAGKYVDFPSQVTSVDWLPSGDKILYVWLENKKATLNVSNPDTTNWHKISDMWETDDAISLSPDGLNILYYETANTATTNPINLTTPDGKVWKSLVKDGYNSGVLWSPDSKKFLFNKKDSTTGQWQLWYYSLQTNTQKNLGISTSVDKVVWDNIGSKIYVAVSSAGGTTGFSSDQFYQIDPETLARKQYNSGNGLVDARNLFLNTSGDKLFFKNNQDGALYYLDLNTSVVPAP